MNNKPFSIKYGWDDFSNSRKLTDFQRYRIRRRYEKDVKEMIQDIIDESISEKRTRRSELNSHNDPKDPFNLDLGGEG